VELSLLLSKWFLLSRQPLSITCFTVYFLFLQVIFCPHFRFNVANNINPGMKWKSEKVETSPFNLKFTE